MDRCQKFGLGLRCPLQGQEVRTLMYYLCYKAYLATQLLFPFPLSLEELIGWTTSSFPVLWVSVPFLSDNGYERQMTGISVCPSVIVLWLILHIIIAINQPVNISDYSHLHRGGKEEKRDRGKQIRNGDVEEMLKLSTARSRHTVCCHGLYALQRLCTGFVCISVLIISPSLNENVQGAPQSSFNASVHSIYNIWSGQCIINYIWVRTDWNAIVSLYSP